MTTAWTSDVFIACVFPLLILFLGYRLAPPTTWTALRALLLKPATNEPFSLQRAHNAFRQYRQLSGAELSLVGASYSRLGRTHKRLGHDIGYPAKLDKLKKVTDLNGRVTDSIAALARSEFGLDGMRSNCGTGDLPRVRESLKHFVRDWSEEGKQERDRIFKPILDVLRTVSADERAKLRVLVPGSGLGRLAWEISQLGFDTTANELSFFMNLAFRFLLSPETTSSVHQHKLHPYAHWFSHQRSNASLFRAVSFPDVLPRLDSKNTRLHLIERDFLSLPVATSLSPQSPEFWSALSRTTESHLSTNKGNESYDYITTLFFIDTSLNVFSTLQHIYALLRPGGLWINLGPLLWTGGAQARVELSLDEVIRVAEEIGFVFDEQTDEAGQQSKSRTVECEYTGDKEAMMRWVYKAEFWVARRPV